MKKYLLLAATCFVALTFSGVPAFADDHATIEAEAAADEVLDEGTELYEDDALETDE